MTASTAALARMTISDTVKIVSGKLVDPLPPPIPIRLQASSRLQ
ncbi:MAG: hypothetical protein WCA55_21210 [Xanthobacteraceae bacterium]|jgi:hypothetical protein